MRAVTALGDAAIVAVYSVVRAGRALLAVVFFIPDASTAFSAAIHQATDTDHIAGAELLYLGAGLNDGADDFVTRGHGEILVGPIAIHRVNVRVADARPADF